MDFRNIIIETRRKRNTIDKSEHQWRRKGKKKHERKRERGRSKNLAVVRGTFVKLGGGQGWPSRRRGGGRYTYSARTCTRLPFNRRLSLPGLKYGSRRDKATLSQGRALITLESECSLKQNTVGSWKPTVAHAPQPLRYNVHRFYTLCAEYVRIWTCRDYLRQHPNAISLSMPWSSEKMAAERKVDWPMSSQ